MYILAINIRIWGQVKAFKEWDSAWQLLLTSQWHVLFYASVMVLSWQLFAMHQVQAPDELEDIAHQILFPDKPSLKRVFFLKFNIKVALPNCSIGSSVVSKYLTYKSNIPKKFRGAPWCRVHTGTWQLLFQKNSNTWKFHEKYMKIKYHEFSNRR